MSDSDYRALMLALVGGTNLLFLGWGLKRREPVNFDVVSTRLCICGNIHLAATCLLATLGFSREACGFFVGVYCNSLIGMPISALLLKDGFSPKN